MKVCISYPPMRSAKGQPTLGQNRQFGWFTYPSYIYPLVPAMAATVLARRGHEVIWNDAIAEEWTYERFLAFFEREAPDLVAFETKTPVVQQHWRIIRELKARAPQTRFVLMGDHVTALPDESMRACPADFVLTGGEFDAGLLSICEYLEGSGGLVPGVWYRDGGEIRSTGPFVLGKRDYAGQLIVDRELTRWDLYGEHLLYQPCTYTMVGRDCWRPRCAFCSWTTLWPTFGTRSARSLLGEIDMILDRYAVKEIFDDTGTFPVGSFLEEFCRGAVERGYDRRVRLSCNMRVNALRPREWERMARAGFRLVKLGIESANQRTLDRLNKGTTVADLTAGCKQAAAAGLSPHLTVMVGYPWESRTEARRTVDLAREFLAKGYARTVQATIVIPYPGTPLFHQAATEGWLKYGSAWSEYDMTKPVMRTEMDDAEIVDLVRQLYGAWMSPRFVLRTLRSIRSLDDVKHCARGARAALGHVLDFRREREGLQREPRVPA